MSFFSRQVFCAVNIITTIHVKINVLLFKKKFGIINKAIQITVHYLFDSIVIYILCFSKRKYLVCFNYILI